MAKFLGLYFALASVLSQSASEAISEQSDPDLELRLVQVVARHGLRAPEYPYPNDPFKDVNKYWPNGWGQLTELGKEQQYELGQFFRRRYGSFLVPKYTSKEAYVLSSDYDRAILSAQLALAGLYENIGNSTEQPANKSTVIGSMVPVHSIPKAFDRMIQPHQECAHLKKLIAETLESNPEMLKHNEQNKELISDIGKQMGIPAKNLVELANSIGSLIIEDKVGLPIPSWGKNLVSSPAKMESVVWLFAVTTLTDEQKRLAAGPILSELTKNMKGKMNGTEGRKFFYYSGHDILIANILNTLGLFMNKPHWPTFSSCLIFELYYRNSSQEYILQIQYKNSTRDDLFEIQLPNCPAELINDSLCNFETFTKLIAPFLPGDLESECRVLSATELYIGLTTFDSALIAAIVILILLLCTSQIYHSSRSKKRDYKFEP